MLKKKERGPLLNATCKFFEGMIHWTREVLEHRNLVGNLPDIKKQIKESVVGQINLLILFSWQPSSLENWKQLSLSPNLCKIRSVNRAHDGLRLRQVEHETKWKKRTERGIFKRTTAGKSPSPKIQFKDSLSVYQGQIQILKVFSTNSKIP